MAEVNADSQNKPLSSYNEGSEFKKELGEKIRDIQLYCLVHNIPFFMTYAIANSDSGTTYETVKLFPTECNRKLHDDNFRLIGLAQMGFDLAMNMDEAFDMDALSVQAFDDDEE